MNEIMMKYAILLSNGDREFFEVVKIVGSKYRDGIMYTFRYICEDGTTEFAIENSHGAPHIHKKERKIDVDYDWKAAIREFEQMCSEHKLRNGIFG